MSPSFFPLIASLPTIYAARDERQAVPRRAANVHVSAEGVTTQQPDRREVQERRAQPARDAR